MKIFRPPLSAKGKNVEEQNFIIIVNMMCRRISQVLMKIKNLILKVQNGCNKNGSNDFSSNSLY